MFNFHLYNGALPYRMFMALTVALCIWGMMSLTADAAVMSSPITEGTPIYHVHEGDAAEGTGCYARPVFHEHTGSRKTGTGCYGKAVKHTHAGSAQSGGGCYGQSLFHVHQGNADSGGGCYLQAVNHSHSGSAAGGGGCYGTPVYHIHQGDETSGGVCYSTPIYHQHEGDKMAGGGCYTTEVSELHSCTYQLSVDIALTDTTRHCGQCDAATSQTMRMMMEKAHTCGQAPIELGGDFICNICGCTTYRYGMFLPEGRSSHEYSVKAYALSCGMGEYSVVGYVKSCPVSEKEVEAYQLSCGKNSGSVEGYVLSCGKSETSVEGYGLTCGFQEGQITEYKRTCGLNTEDIIGYELSCGMDEQTVVGMELPKVEAEEMEQPVKVPIKLLQENEGKEESVYIEAVVGGVKHPGDAVSAEDAVPIQTKPDQVETLHEAEEVTQATNPFLQMEGQKELLVSGIVLILAMLLVKLYFSNTVALFYFDDRNQYHSLGRIRYKRTGKGYHVEIGNGLRKKATTDRYRIRTTKNMQKAAKDAHLFVRISTQVMKLGLEEYVDFAL